MLVHVSFVCVARTTGLQSLSPTNSYGFVGTRLAWLAQRRDFCSSPLRMNTAFCWCLRLRLVRLPRPSFSTYPNAFRLHLLWNPCLWLVLPSLVPSSCLTNFGACSFSRVLYTAYCCLKSILGEQTSLRYRQFALFPLSFALLSVIRQFGTLTIVNWTGYDVAQSLLASSHLESIDWFAFGSSDLDNSLWVSYELKSGVATAPLLRSVPYAAGPVLDFATASCQV